MIPSHGRPAICWSTIRRMPPRELRRLMFAASLTVAACGSPAVVQPAGRDQYIVTVTCPIWHCPRENPSRTQAIDAARETCARVGMTTVAEYRSTPANESNPRHQQLKFECLAPYEIAPIDSETLALYGSAVKGSYKMWVPASEIGAGTAGFKRAMQRPTDYCAKMNMIMKQTGGGFDSGNGLDVIFSCVPKQE
jgi:hypothetical protein